MERCIFTTDIGTAKISGWGKVNFTYKVKREIVHTLGNESNKNQPDVLSIHLFYLFSEELVSLSSTEFLQKGTGFHVDKFFKLFDPTDKKINSKM